MKLRNLDGKVTRYNIPLRGWYGGPDYSPFPNGSFGLVNGRGLFLSCGFNVYLDEILSVDIETKESIGQFHSNRSLRGNDDDECRMNSTSGITHYDISKTAYLRTTDNLITMCFRLDIVNDNLRYLPSKDNAPTTGQVPTGPVTVGNGLITMTDGKLQTNEKCLVSAGGLAARFFGPEVYAMYSDLDNRIIITANTFSLD